MGQLGGNGSFARAMAVAAKSSSGRSALASRFTITSRRAHVTVTEDTLALYTVGILHMHMAACPQHRHTDTDAVHRSLSISIAP